VETIMPGRILGSYGGIVLRDDSRKIRWDCHSVFGTDPGVVIDGGRVFNVRDPEPDPDLLLTYFLVHSICGKHVPYATTGMSANSLQNHSCAPNAHTVLILAPGKATIVAFKAKTKILAGEWITISYWGERDEVSRLVIRTCYTTMTYLFAVSSTTRRDAGHQVCVQLAELQGIRLAMSMYAIYCIICSMLCNHVMFWAQTMYLTNNAMKILL
jgi:hypothetical protein